MAADKLFGFVQFEFAFPLGPADGRYLRRTAEDGEPERVIVLRTQGAEERRRKRGGRRAKDADAAASETPEPVPITRATLIRAEPLGEPDEAERWLDALRGDDAARDGEVDDARRELNAIVRAHRAAAGDPHAREVGRWHANALRVGYGTGNQVAEGHFTAAVDVPAPRDRVRRAETLAPQERLAAVLGGSDRVLVAEELALRAWLDIDGKRPREAALQARVALEALLAELPGATSDVAPHRDAVAQAANAALLGDPPAELQDAVAEAVRVMRRAMATASRGVT